MHRHLLPDGGSMMSRSPSIATISKIIVAKWPAQAPTNRRLPTFVAGNAMK